MNNVEIIKPGLFTTLQDMGRWGYRKYGIPVSGGLDKYSAALAHMLLNNPSGGAVLEIFMKGPEILFNLNTYISITGADMSPSVDGKAVKMNSVIAIKRGQVLSFGKLVYGSVTYLAFSNEIISETILGSKSYYKGVTPIDRIFKGQIIALGASQLESKPNTALKIQKEHFLTNKIQVISGPEYYLLGKKNEQLLTNYPFKISREYNRMGYKIEGPPLLVSNSGSMISSATLPGTVQLTPSGQLIILMNDCQATGGYPRVLHLPQYSINQLAQKKSGDEFWFRL